ncbi:MAG: formate/nitrite transporter family protein [Acidobacteriota bacterium]
MAPLFLSVPGGRPSASTRGKAEPRGQKPRTKPPSRTGKQGKKPDSESGGPSAGTRLSADEIYENISDAAEEELERPATDLIWSAIAAGLAIGFSFLAAAFLASLVPEAWKTAAHAVGYPLGFIFVVLARQQLFTENTLEPVIPLLRKPEWSTFRKVAALWAVVFAGNMLGAVVFAWAAARTEMLDRKLTEPLLRLARESTEGGFGIVTYKAVFAGWLIALMAWLVASTLSTFAQISLIWLSTAPIAALGFRHSIAGSVEAFYRTFSGDAPWGRMLGGFVVPCVLGNIIGGVLLVALLNHKQVSEITRGAT